MKVCADAGRKKALSGCICELCLREEQGVGFYHWSAWPVGKPEKRTESRKYQQHLLAAKASSYHPAKESMA